MFVAQCLSNSDLVSRQSEREATASIPGEMTALVLLRKGNMASKALHPVLPKLLPTQYKLRQVCASYRTNSR